MWGVVSRMQTSRNYITNWSLKFGRNPSNGRQEEMGGKDSRANMAILETWENGRCILERTGTFD